MIQSIAQRIMAIKNDFPVRVAFDGIDGAGKSTLAAEVASVLRAGGRDVIEVSVDGFCNPPDVRARRGQLSAEGYWLDTFNYDALKENLIHPLGPGGDLMYRERIFDYRLESTVGGELSQAQQDSILIFDGIFSQRSELVDEWHLVVYVDVTFEVALERVLKRDVELFGTTDNVKKRYTTKYFPGQRIYLDQCGPRQRADIVVDNNDLKNPHIV